MKQATSICYRISWDDFAIAKDRSYQYGFGKPQVLAKHTVLSAIAQDNAHDWHQRLMNAQTMTRTAFRMLLQVLGVPKEQRTLPPPAIPDTAAASRTKVEAGVSGGAEIRFSLLPDEAAKLQAQAITARIGSIHAYSQFLFYESLAHSPQQRFEEAMASFEQTVLQMFQQGVKHSQLTEEQAAWCVTQLERFHANLASSPPQGINAKAQMHTAHIR